MTRQPAFTIIAAALLAGTAAPALAQGSPAPPPGTPASALVVPEGATNAMVNLIRLLVQQGTISKANGEALLRQAVSEAGQARAVSGELSAPPAGTMRVPYIPQGVRNQIRDELKAEMMKEVQTAGWASPGQAAPEWTRRIRLSGDVRFRGETDRFAKGNANDIIDYSAINATPGGFDFYGNNINIPILDTRVDRNRLRVRARLGIAYDPTDFATVGVRLATGDDNSPISTNQTLGGGFSKKNIWLDQAYLQLRPTKFLTANLGRFENPFTSTDLVFDRDLNFDGIEAEVHSGAFLGGRTQLALRGGAFPLDFGSVDYPSTSVSKEKYPTKWLFAAQAEAATEFGGGIKVNAAAAYYHFSNIQGQLSAPCLFNGQTISIGTSDPVECSTDGSRAIFPRKGNTLFFIRNITVPAPDTLPAANRQYLGLTYKYSLLDLNASIEAPVLGRQAVLTGNYVRNLAYKHGDECRFGVGIGTPITNVISVNNNDNACSAASPALVDSGNQGYLVRLLIGDKNPKRFGEWNIVGDYRYLDTDATLDSLTDSDFHLGGTNAKGYSIGGTFGLYDGVAISGRWLSANEVRGRPLAIDVFQIDLIGQF